MAKSETVHLEMVDLTDDIMSALIENGFAPMEDEMFGITARDAKVLSYFAERAWDAYRVDASEEWATLVRWDADGIDLLAIDEHGVSLGRLSFPMTPRGVNWLTQVIG